MVRRFLHWLDNARGEINSVACRGILMFTHMEFMCAGLNCDAGFVHASMEIFTQRLIIPPLLRVCFAGALFCITQGCPPLADSRKSPPQCHQAALQPCTYPVQTSLQASPERIHWLVRDWDTLSFVKASTADCCQILSDLRSRNSYRTTVSGRRIHQIRAAALKNSNQPLQWKIQSSQRVSSTAASAPVSCPSRALGLQTSSSTTRRHVRRWRFQKDSHDDFRCLFTRSRRVHRGPQSWAEPVNSVHSRQVYF